MNPHFSFIRRSRSCNDDDFCNKPTNLNKKICLLGDLANDKKLRTVAESFNLPIVTLIEGADLYTDNWNTIFIMKEFKGNDFNMLHKKRQYILGPPALINLAFKKQPLSSIMIRPRPLYCRAMLGITVCFAGFREEHKHEMVKMVPLIHHMGGSVRKEMCSPVTHLIANVAGGDKYQYAIRFRVPIKKLQWIHASWERRSEPHFRADSISFIEKYSLKTFHGIRMHFVGFPAEVDASMTRVLYANGGSLSNLDYLTCTLVVVSSEFTELLQPILKQFKGSVRCVTAEWFNKSVDSQFCHDEEDYLREDSISSSNMNRTYIVKPSALLDQRLD